jgi:hypothetical protein
MRAVAATRSAGARPASPRRPAGVPAEIFVFEENGHAAAIRAAAEADLDDD